MARRWLPSLEGKGLLEESTRRATATGGGYSGPAYMNTWNVDRAVKDGYDRVIWVFRAVDHIASSASRLPIEIRVGDENGPVAEGVRGLDPLLRLLNRVSNAWEPAAAFRYRLSSQLLLSKRGVFVEIIRSRMGDPIALHLLPAGATRPVPHPTKFIEEFEVTVNSIPERIPAFEEDGVSPRVLWIRKPHPTDPYSGVTPMEAAGISIDMDFYARLYNRSFLQNDGRPGGLLGIKGNMDPEDKAEVRRRFGGGPREAGRTTVIKADELSWVDTAINPRDAQFAEIMRITKTDILDAFGVYESLIGNASGRTFDNAAQEKTNFWQETMPPHLDIITGAFDYLTSGGIEDDLYLVHNTEGVPILQKSREDRDKALKDLFDAGLITADEFREETGRELRDTEGARTLWIAGTKRDMDGAPAPAAPVAPTEASAPTPPEVKTVKALTSSEDAITAAVDKRIATYQRTIKRFFNRQERVVLERLGGPKARKGTPLETPSPKRGAAWVPGNKALDVNDVLDRERWDEELAEDLGPLVEDTYAEEADAAGVDLDEEAATTAAGARLANAAKVNDTTADKLTDALRVDDGETLDDVRARVKDVYEEARTSRATAIAETEAAGATNEARDLIAAVVGTKRKRWRSRADGKVRETHKTAHGQERSVEKAFSVGGATLRYPGDPGAPIKEIARCRCWVEYLRDDD